jgi:hypothetical protein
MMLLETGSNPQCQELSQVETAGHLMGLLNDV